jgi:transposase
MGRKAVSVDMKKKIINFYEAGLSKRTIAQKCDISRNCVIQTIRKYTDCG